MWTWTRRDLVIGTALALVAGVGLAAAPTATAADSGSLHITWSEPSSLRISATAGLPDFTAAEELTIESTSPTRITVSIVDELSDSGWGRPLLYGSAPGCPTIPQSAPVAQWDCTLPRSIGFVTVDLTPATTYTQTVIRGSLPLVFNGGSGRDDVYGGAGDDDVSGYDGSDRLYGGAGDDRLVGGPGDDYLEGESGLDVMQGGSGTNSIDAADGQGDAVDCGGAPPALLDFDKRIDAVINCGFDPAPVPPAPLEPVDPPANGQGQALIDGRPTDIATVIGPNSTEVSNPVFDMIISTVFNAFLYLQRVFFLYLKRMMANSRVDTYLFSDESDPEIKGRGLGAAQAIPVDSLTADASGNVNADNLRLPPGLKAGNYTLQVTGTLASGAQAIVNLGVTVAEDVPGPTPEPTISVVSAKRGKGKKATTITVQGTTAELAGSALTPRFQIQGRKGFATANPVTVAANGSFIWRLKSPKKTRIFFQAGAVRSRTVTVAAAKG